MLKNAEKIKEYLKENRKSAIYLMRELNSWDGSYSFVDTWDLTELATTFRGDYASTNKFIDLLLNSLDTLKNDSDIPVRFSEYGDYLESVSMEDLNEEVLDYIDDDLLYAIEEHYPHDIDIDFDDKLKALIDEG